jgi:ATP-binding cassette subfamily B multidrug efflux pump
MRIFVKAPLMCIGSIIMATILDPSLSLIMVAIVPLVIVIIYLNTRIGYPFFRKVQRAIDKVNGVMREYLSGARVVKAFNRSDFEEDRFSTSNENLAYVQTSAMKVMAVFSPATMIVINLGIIAVLWFGGVGIDKGSLQVGKIIAFINYMTQMSSSLMMISSVFTMFVRARASAERIGEVMNVPETIKKAEAPVDSGRAADIRFDNVSFSYSGNLDEPVLKNISFECSPGETIGIIGTTGSGKTTVVSLIPRFYEATSGSILVGGVDVRQVDEHALRDKIAIVPQKNTLFTGTILENIRWGNASASPEEAAKAAETAQAHEFIMATPEGYDTMLGQGGVNLSGGQKQRLSIARALVKNPAILILDDCTSAVDVITEARIRKGLKSYSEELICLIIAQRISSVMAVDKILVLDNGCLVGSGSHGELLVSCGVYREIYESQFGKEEAENAGR